MKMIVLAFLLFFSVNVFSVEGIIIQVDYWNGTKCLENGVPWQVPASIYKESENCNNEDIVLEIGTGGSTIFFAKRCARVIAIETNPQWAASVQSKIDSLDLKNVELFYIPKQELIEEFLKNLDTGPICIFSVDSVHGYNRSAFIDRFLEHGISQNLRMVVLDNYGAPELFPAHYNRDLFYTTDWKTFVYDDPRWCGRGTKLYIKK